MNSLVDPQAIVALSAASRAGVRIDLLIRGICCLRPGLLGISENIRVISIVDKFLEHSRISYFQNNDDPQVFLSSADWMPRNFRRRVEIIFPIDDPRLKNRIIDGLLGVSLMDNVKARELGPDGIYRRVAVARPGEPAIRSQIEFQNMARELSVADAIRPSRVKAEANYFARSYEG
jgi:polyphosphate kinase